VTKISSKWTFFHKRIFPFAFFGFIAFFFADSWDHPDHEPDFMFYIVPVVMAVFMFGIMKKFVWDLADEVYDSGDSLLVRRRGEEERINLSNIINVNVSSSANQPRITLRLDKPGRLGREVAFSPASGGFTLNPFAKNPIGEDLIARVDRARTKRAV
jgi:hypothetical protein